MLGLKLIHANKVAPGGAKAKAWAAMILLLLYYSSLIPERSQNCILSGIVWAAYITLILRLRSPYS